jgi:glucokinase
MRWAIAVDLGATNTRVGLVNEEGSIKEKITAPTPGAPLTAEGVGAFLVSLIRQLQSEAHPPVVGIGISAAGPVDIHQGLLVNPPNIPIRNIPLVEPLQRAFGIPVYLANDCHAGVIGEAYFGDGSGIENLAYITISTGIGGGILSGGKLLLGTKGNAVEIGHFLVDTSYNLVCGCGHPGHWERYASGRFLPDFFRAWSTKHGHAQEERYSSAQDLFRAADRNEPVVLAFLEELGTINGRGLSDVIVAYDPERIVLDGSVILSNTQHILPAMIRHTDRFLPLPEIHVSQLHGDAPLLGASILASGYQTKIGTLKLSD